MTEPPEDEEGNGTPAAKPPKDSRFVVKQPPPPPRLLAQPKEEAEKEARERAAAQARAEEKEMKRRAKAERHAKRQAKLAEQGQVQQGKPEDSLARDQEKANKIRRAAGLPEEALAAKSERAQKLLAKMMSYKVRSREVVDLTHKELGEIEQRKRPLILGPYIGEIGFELLYWIPLIRWTLQQFPDLRDRITVVSRGGVEHWYSGLGARYVDVLELYSREELIERRESLKQRVRTGFEEELTERARTRLGIEEADVIHPSLLFNAYYRFLDIDQRAYARAVEHFEDKPTEGLLALYEPLPPIVDDRLDDVLPEEFVAVRFYYRASFPESEENARFAASVIESLAQQTNVVLLNTRIEMDEHIDFDAAPEGSVTTIYDHLQPADNLHVQSLVLSRSQGFVGTYGGLVYLSTFLNVPALGFTSTTDGQPWHLDLGKRIVEGSGWGPVVTMGTRDLPFVARMTNGMGREGSALEPLGG